MAQLSLKNAKATHQAYKLSPRGNKVTVTAPGHPLRGKRLRVDTDIAARSDGYIMVIIPDGSRALLPLTWTDLSPSERSDEENPRFSLEGLRRLVEAIDELSSRA